MPKRGTRGRFVKTEAAALTAPAPVPTPAPPRHRTESERLLSITRTAHWVDYTTWTDFHRRWAEIDQMWPYNDPEHFAVIAGLKETAREELRAEVKRAHPIGPRQYLIAV